MQLLGRNPPNFSFFVVVEVVVQAVDDEDEFVVVDEAEVGVDETGLVAVDVASADFPRAISEPGNVMAVD